VNVGAFHRGLTRPALAVAMLIAAVFLASAGTARADGTFGGDPAQEVTPGLSCQGGAPPDVAGSSTCFWMWSNPVFGSDTVPFRKSGGSTPSPPSPSPRWRIGTDAGGRIESLHRPARRRRFDLLLLPGESDQPDLHRPGQQGHHGAPEPARLGDRGAEPHPAREHLLQRQAGDLGALAGRVAAAPLRRRSDLLQHRRRHCLSPGTDRNQHVLRPTGPRDWLSAPRQLHLRNRDRDDRHGIGRGLFPAGFPRV